MRDDELEELLASRKQGKRILDDALLGAGVGGGLGAYTSNMISDRAEPAQRYHRSKASYQNSKAAQLDSFGSPELARAMKKRAAGNMQKASKLGKLLSITGKGKQALLRGGVAGGLTGLVGVPLLDLLINSDEEE